MLPSGPGSAPITAPHFSPGGSWAQFASRRNGFGRSFVGVALFHFGSFCAPTPHVAMTINAETAEHARFDRLTMSAHPELVEGCAFRELGVGRRRSADHPWSSRGLCQIRLRRSLVFERRHPVRVDAN